MNTVWSIHTMKYYSATKNDATTRMNLENVMLSEISQARKDNYGMILLM